MSSTTLPRLLVVGDPYFSCEAFRTGLAELAGKVEVSYLQIPTTEAPSPRTPSEARLREFVGDAGEIAQAAVGYEMLAVHGAAISDEVLATPGLRLVTCARGGPVNVDLAAATEHDVIVCNTPGKNAPAVADLTIAFALLLLRGVFSSHASLLSNGPGSSVFDGKEYFGAEPQSTTLGLVGYGYVGREVAARARALGFHVIAHDPFVDAERHDGTGRVSLEELLASSDIVSLHARSTAGARPLMDAAAFARMKPDAYFINTAREQLVDEASLLRSLDSGSLRGAALDVVEFGSVRNLLLDHPRVLVTPHIGGATAETLTRGAQMASESISAYLRGELPAYALNPAVFAPLTAGRPS